jgi:hypothetical protein
MISIRKANIHDSATILNFVVELARYEKAEHEVTASVDDIKNSIFGSDTSTFLITTEAQPVSANVMAWTLYEHHL